MRQQATKSNDAQILQHIERQRRGIPGMEFSQSHPVIDAVAGGLILALFFGTAISGWIAIGSGVVK
ncbi:MAG: hypothetical protein K5804_17865 [Microbacterium sp.]|uniref:hypothetical protein n=1 Tax=Microbacterium sp. TaxID=51671 RepID=UPI00260E8CC7|nr:hypothetical protein [Microbacterium sp.]MCV0420112.1 hypothetical protein [Microbacterium sp.]